VPIRGGYEATTYSTCSVLDSKLVTIHVNLGALANAGEFAWASNLLVCMSREAIFAASIRNCRLQHPTRNRSRNSSSAKYVTYLTRYLVAYYAHYTVSTM
jgi:hypothetical protein